MAFIRFGWGADLVVRQAHHEVHHKRRRALMVSLSNHEGGVHCLTAIETATPHPSLSDPRLAGIA